MKTQIFKSYVEFLRREDKTVNGVSPSFAEHHPNWELDNATNRGCWNCSRCSDCSGCSDCSRCSGCFDCSDCSDCFGCFDCSDCSDCSGKIGIGVLSQIPKINNIHSEILRAVSEPDALDMGDWHTCDTTHCRAGWVTTLAGEQGRKLEKETSTEFAAMMIYKASSPDIRVSPVRFYEDNETAMADIKRCAELEKSQ